MQAQPEREAVKLEVKKTQGIGKGGGGVIVDKRKEQKYT